MIKVFYNPSQSVSKNISFSPSCGKPEKVAKQFQEKFASKIEFVSEFKPLSAPMISMAHNPKYVHDILRCKTPNGFGNKMPEVAKSLRWTTSSFFHAAEEAFRKKSITCSLTSGFHHASYNGGSGFCTFNGLVIAAQLLRAYYGISRIGIIDLDAHYGNGTDNIIKKLDLDYITHYTFGGDQNEKEWEKESFEEFLLETFKGCRVIFYQAGADPWKHDPLGGFMTKEQLRQRDEIVFRVAKKLDIGIVWNLAGGYAKTFQHVLDIHNNTMIEAIFSETGEIDSIPETDDQEASNGELTNSRHIDEELLEQDMHKEDAQIDAELEAELANNKEEREFALLDIKEIA